MRVTIVLVLMMGLAACVNEESMTYEEWLQQPQRYQQTLKKCELIDQANITVDCQRVSFMAAHLQEWLLEQQESPQQFGNHILMAEMAVGNVALQRSKAQNDLASLQLKQASAKEIMPATKALEKIDADYQVKYNEYALLLAIAGLSSPT